MEETGALGTVSGNIKWYSHYGWSYLKELQKELSHEIAISLLGIYPKEPDNKFSKRYLHSSVHCSVIHKTQEMETI